MNKIGAVIIIGGLVFMVVDFERGSAIYDILKMEFERRDCLDGEDVIISEMSFAQLLLLHANIDERKMKGMLKRVRKKYQDGPGITFEELICVQLVP
ncbi:unnamed protein product, partial [Mesorhabditis spiculigera]